MSGCRYSPYDEPSPVYASWPIRFLVTQEELAQLKAMLEEPPRKLSMPPLAIEPNNPVYEGWR